MLPSMRVRFLSALVLFLNLLLAGPAWAADTTAPTKPAVSDDGGYTASATQLHAAWTSSDPESGIVAYQYLIRQDSTAGTVIVNWTSTGAAISVIRTGLSLLQGKSYFFGVSQSEEWGWPLVLGGLLQRDQGRHHRPFGPWPAHGGHFHDGSRL